MSKKINYKYDLFDFFSKRSQDLKRIKINNKILFEDKVKQSGLISSENLAITIMILKYPSKNYDIQFIEKTLEEFYTAIFSMLERNEEVEIISGVSLKKEEINGVSRIRAISKASEIDLLKSISHLGEDKIDLIRQLVDFFATKFLEKNNIEIGNLGSIIFNDDKLEFLESNWCLEMINMQD